MSGLAAGLLRVLDVELDVERVPGALLLGELVHLVQEIPALFLFFLGEIHREDPETVAALHVDDGVEAGILVVALDPHHH